MSLSVPCFVILLEIAKSQMILVRNLGILTIGSTRFAGCFQNALRMKKSFLKRH